MSTQERILIGESGNNGLPISAEIRRDYQHQHFPPMRWVQHPTHFALEVFHDGGWEEVPCLVPTEASTEGSGEYVCTAERIAPKCPGCVHCS